MRSLLAPAALLLAAASIRPLPAQEDVSFAAADGQPLTGTFYKASDKTALRGGLLLLPGYPGDRRDFPSLAAELTHAGFHCLALDLRGHGGSRNDAKGQPVAVEGAVLSDPGRNPFLVMHRDARAGLEKLVERGAPSTCLGIAAAGPGACVALHTAVEHPAMVHALVLLSPGVRAVGLPTETHASRQRGRPVFILTSEEERDLGPATVSALIEEDLLRFRVLEERGVHGTGMFGRVPGIEVEIAEFFEAALGQGPSWQAPWCRDIVIDGSVEDQEALRAFRMDIKHDPPERTSHVRIARDRRRLIVGFKIPERYMRRNEVTVYCDRDLRGTGLGESSLKIAFSPADPEREPLEVHRGENGRWIAADASGIRAYANTRNRDRWEAEIAIPLDMLIDDGDAGGRIRLALRIRGQREGDLLHHPASPNIENSPRLWQPTEIAPLR